MQTLYFTTRNFVRTEGNLVDLADYRRRLRSCSGYDGSLEVEDTAQVWELPPLEETWEVLPGGEEVVLTTPRTRRDRRNTGFFSLSNLPELCATLAVAVTALTVLVRFLQF